MRIFKLLMVIGLLTVGTAAISATLDDRTPVPPPSWTMLDAAYKYGDKLVLTPDQPHKVGDAWCEASLDLFKNFDLTFQIYLGDKEDDGADGVAFVLTPVDTFSQAGPDITYRGISPSLSIVIDYPPFPGQPQEPAASPSNRDRIAIVGTYTGLTEYPGIPYSELPDLETGAEHTVRFNWTALSNTMQVYFDNDNRPAITYTNNIVSDYLAGHNLVKFGFSGTTGDIGNEQYVVPVDIRAAIDAAATSANHSVRDDWTLAESAKWENDKIILTPDLPNLVGVAWDRNLIDLTHIVDLQFRIFLGAKDVNGGDGIAFVLTTPGNTAPIGAGLGYAGISPSLAIEIDTNKTEIKDLPGNHMAVDLNGMISHEGSWPIASISDLKDGKEHIFRIIWDPITKILSAYVDDLYNPVIEYQSDIIKNVFDGQTMVRFGFTGSTGESTDRQYIVPVRL